MIKKINKNEDRKMRAERVREKISGTTERPRLNVFRSLNNIYAQVIDDTKGITLAQSSTMDKAIVKSIEGKTKQEASDFIKKYQRDYIIKQDEFYNYLYGNNSRSDYEMEDYCGIPPWEVFSPYDI